MMHLQFPKRRDFYSWEELSCLSRALGFPSETITNCIPEEVTKTQDGISLKAILKLIELKYFNDALDRSINMHTADYNINTLLKSLKLLNHRLLSFSELNDVRVAFQVYEAGDMRGMVIDTHTQLRALKLCDRTIAPMKMTHRIKHMQENFDEPGRIQLYEFLDLIVLCELSKDVDVPDFKYGALDKTWRRLFQLDNFEEVCTTKDEKLEQRLNQQFRETELNYGKEQLASKRIPRESAVDTSRRIEQVRHHNRKYRELQGFMGQSTAQVQRTKAGHVRCRPVTAPEIDAFRLPPDSPLHSLPRPHTVSDFFSSVESTMPEDPRIRLLQALHEKRTLKSVPPGSTSRNARTELANSSLSSEQPWKSMINTYVRPSTPRVVTEQDVVERQHVLDSLQYQIETLEERTLQKLEQQMKMHLPRYYRQKKETMEDERRTPTPIKPKKKGKKKKSKVAHVPPESIERLVHPVLRQYHDVHDKNCDARMQEFDVPKSSRRPKTKGDERKSENFIPKPQLFLDGRRLSVSSDKNFETASTMSSMADSSIARTTDLASHSLPLHSAFSHKQRAPSPPRVHDPEKFRESRVGAAAVLHDFFNDVKADASSDTSSVKQAEHPRDAVLGDNRQSQARNSSIQDSHARSPARLAKKTASDPRLSRWEKARIMRKITLQEEEELKINGISLSEIDRLTFKGEDEQIQDLRMMTKISSQDLYMN
ncbi:uncharacterized protein LOC110975537 isoform X2 [Acanthaster planci]|uniref:Uncharacterized protein LOC110975537 isoform X2 n=1 Tax=Acanthaster planci TaxID=133434 RepID=A0A8B7XSF6_ACAPL|nr:uncharacterized protein LOC110975537 isoform X2 [Acanthaster planci]